MNGARNLGRSRSLRDDKQEGSSTGRRTRRRRPAPETGALLEFDQAAVEHLFEEFDYVLLDDAGGRFVGLAEGCDERVEKGGFFEESPDVGTGFAEAEALAGIEGHE